MSATYTAANGEQHTFQICTYDGDWRDVGGIYMMCAFEGTSWVPKYIGMADSFKNRLTRHHDQWEPSQRLGASRILAKVIPGIIQRVRVEAMLIGELNPPLNVQHRTAPSGLAAVAYPPQTMALRALLSAPSLGLASKPAASRGFGLLNADASAAGGGSRPAAAAGLGLADTQIAGNRLLRALANKG